jgi:hypothetical protein
MNSYSCSFEGPALGQEAVQEALAAGASAVISKSDAVTALIEKARKLLDTIAA